MKSVIITGANTGIGFATAETFLKNGDHVIMACRNVEKALAAKNKLQHIKTGKVEIIQLDLNSLDQVNHTANQLLNHYEKIDVLVNNAGIMTTHLETTQEGYEKQFGVNYLGHFLWTLKLLPLLKNAEAGRIIHLSSMMHLMGKIPFNQFHANDVKKYNGVLRYANSKLANLLFSNLLAEQLKHTQVTSNAIHPGGVDSEIYCDLPHYQYLAIKLFLISPQKPAQLIFNIASDLGWSKKTGTYTSLQTPAIQSRKAQNLQLAQQL